MSKTDLVDVYRDSDVLVCLDGGGRHVTPAHAQVEALAANLPGDWAATVLIMHGCGLRIGEALAANIRCRVGEGKTLRIAEQVNPTAQLRPLKFRKAGE